MERDGRITHTQSCGGLLRNSIHWRTRTDVTRVTSSGLVLGTGRSSVLRHCDAVDEKEKKEGEGRDLAGKGVR